MPARRPSTRHAGWRRSKRRGSCGSHSPAASSSASARRESERMDSLAALAGLHARHGHIQEVILQNFVPHQRYYGQEPAEIADEAAREYWRTGVADGRPELPLPDVGLPGEHRGHEAADRRGPAADARRRHPDPTQPRRLVGRARGCGRDRPRRSLGQRRSHLPRAPVPLAPPGAQGASEGRVALTERLCVYPQYIDQDWIAQGVMDTIKVKYWSFIPRRGLWAHRAAHADRAEPRPGCDRARAARGRP